MAKVIYFGFQKMRSWNASKVELNDKIEWVYGDFASFKNEATLWRVWLFFFTLIVHTITQISITF